MTTGFILDSSVAICWHLESKEISDKAYAEAVLRSLSGTDATVPAFWRLETASAILKAEYDGKTSVGEVENFFVQLDNLPLVVDSLLPNHSLNRVMSIARGSGVSCSRGVYLELAIRQGLPIATVDKHLQKAAIKAGIPVYLGS